MLIQQIRQVDSLILEDTMKILCGFFEQFWPFFRYVFRCIRTGAGLHSEPKRVLCKIHAAIYTIARRALHERMQ